jgi:hypothetical protein
MEQWRNPVSEILGERYHYQFRAICVDIKEVRTTNSQGSAKQEDESSPPSAWQRQTAHQSAHKGGNCNNGLDCSPSCCLQSRFSTLLLPSFLLRAGCLRGRRFADDDELKHSVREELGRFSKEFYTTGTQRLTQRWKKCVDTEEDFVVK